MGRGRRAGQIILILSVLALSTTILLPASTGRPLVSYASSESMEPTIGVFDVFFVEPWPEELGVGDIVVFRSVIRDGPAVHRIVGGDKNGWITQGDANPAADQTAGEPPLTRDRVLGRVVTTPSGQPILVPNAAISLVEANAQLARLRGGTSNESAPTIFLGLAALFAILAVFAGSKDGPRRPMRPRVARVMRRLFPRGILGRHVGAALLVVLLTTFAWSAFHARAEVELTLVVVEDPRAADTVRAAAPGGSLPRDVEVEALRAFPTLVFVEGTERVETPSKPVRLAPGESDVVRVHERAGDEVGLQRDAALVWRYPHVLPAPLLIALHDAAPGLPYFLALGLAAIAGALWFRWLGLERLPVGRMFGMREDWR